MEAFDAAQVRCPTCRALQNWSDVCRRCKCDLRLVRAAAATFLRIEAACHVEISAGRHDRALRHARRCVHLCPGQDSYRLLAVCALLNHDWNLALAAERLSFGSAELTRNLK